MGRSVEARIYLPARLRVLGLQLTVPIKIVHPAFMKIVRREQPSVGVQLIDGWLDRMLARPHLRILRQLPPFAQIAGRARGNHVVPKRLAAERPRDYMVKRQIFRNAAILALELVP